MLRKKISTIIPPALFLLLLLFAGILAITQESDEDDFEAPEPAFDETMLDALFTDGEEYDGEYSEDIWMPPGPPRWFRSNAGGMALEEVPSRLYAIRNEYALVIDYIAPDELDPFLIPFYAKEFNIEIHVLYEEGRESRRQWLFRDEAGSTRVNAVFRYTDADPADNEDLEYVTSEFDDAEDSDEYVPVPRMDDSRTAAGFVEVYGENSLIAGDYLFPEEGEQIMTEYFYNGSTLIRAETAKKTAGTESSGYEKMYTDNYRYNRSSSLRYVERLYHETVINDPVRLLFPYRILDAASSENFLSEKLFPQFDFFGEQMVAEGFRMVYETDSRGRIQKQTLFNNNDEIVWVIVNTWSGDRIASVKKTEGENVWLTEYRHDGKGKRTEQRDTHNGVLERLVLIDGDRETEELYMNGVVILRAFWEDGRKISEERVRR